MIPRRAVIAVVGSLWTAALAGCGAAGRLEDLRSGGGDPRQLIVETYDEALTRRNDATETRDTGVNLFNAGEYEDAIDRLETALAGYETTATEFTEAAGLAGDLDNETEATGICERAAEATRLQARATEAALEAATAANESADAATITTMSRRSGASTRRPQRSPLRTRRRSQPRSTSPETSPVRYRRDSASCSG